MDSWDVCRMATSTGARALGLDHAIGTLETGKQADIIAVRTDTPRMTPLVTGRLANLHHNLVFAVQGGDVRMSMVAGRVVVDDGQLLTGDLAAVIAETNATVPGLFQRREAWLNRSSPAAVVF